MHPDGSVSVQDRGKDIIISGGEVRVIHPARLTLADPRTQNASSLAIEQELVTHPDVLEAAVVARPHPKWGERPMVFVTLRPSKVSKWENRQAEFEAALKVHARKTLPGFATPEWVAIVPQLPVSVDPLKTMSWHFPIPSQKTSTGKMLKADLRKRIAKL